MPDREVVARLFDVVAARYGDARWLHPHREGGASPLSDAAPMVLLELVDRVEPEKDGKGKKGQKREKPPEGEGKRAKKEQAAAGPSADDRQAEL